MAELVLEPVEIAGPMQWRWLLRTDDGEPLASHEVALRPTDYEYAGFADLYRFLRWQAVPDRRVDSEAGLTTRVENWITREVLGESVVEALLAEAPITVRVPVPAALPFLPYRPWELAIGDGAALGREQVTFVFELPGRRPSRTGGRAAGERLRLLALFSLPSGASVLGLRRERYTLHQLICDIGQGTARPGRCCWSVPTARRMS